VMNVFSLCITVTVVRIELKSIKSASADQNLHKRFQSWSISLQIDVLYENSVKDRSGLSSLT